MMGYRMNLEQLAISRFAIQAHLEKHKSAAPSPSHPNVNQSTVRLSVASKKNLSKGHQHHLSLSVGMDAEAQALRYSSFSKCKLRVTKCWAISRQRRLLKLSLR
jgi:hypothetical protein